MFYVGLMIAVLQPKHVAQKFNCNVLTNLLIILVAFLDCNKHHCSYVSFFPLHTKIYPNSNVPSRASQISEGHRSLQNCGSSVWNFLQFTDLRNRISRWFLNFWKMGVVLVAVNFKISHTRRLFRYQSLIHSIPHRLSP